MSKGCGFWPRAREGRAPPFFQSDSVIALSGSEMIHSSSCVSLHNMTNPAANDWLLHLSFIRHDLMMTRRFDKNKGRIEA